MANEHSPTPWTLRRIEIDGKEPYDTLSDANGEWIVSFKMPTDAAFALAAVNAHQALLDLALLLKTAIQTGETWSEDINRQYVETLKKAGS